MKSIDIIQRVIEWNAARYEQEYDDILTNSLLESEILELDQADRDGACGNIVDQVDALGDIIYVAIGAMWKLGLDEAQIYSCIAAICTANETKEIVKTESHIKANINKGTGFISPEAAIERIINNG